MGSVSLAEGHETTMKKDDSQLSLGGAIGTTIGLLLFGLLCLGGGINVAFGDRPALCGGVEMDEGQTCVTTDLDTGSKTEETASDRRRGEGLARGIFGWAAIIVGSFLLFTILGTWLTWRDGRKVAKAPAERHDPPGAP
jgi:hypothetical protein